MSDDRSVAVGDLATLFEQTLRAYYGTALNFEHVLHALEAMDGFFWAWKNQVPNAHRLVEAMIAPSATPAIAQLFQHGFIRRDNARFSGPYTTPLLLLRATLRLTARGTPSEPSGVRSIRHLN